MKSSQSPSEKKFLTFLNQLINWPPPSCPPLSKSKNIAICLLSQISYPLGIPYPYPYSSILLPPISCSQASSFPLFSVVYSLISILQSRYILNPLSPLIYPLSSAFCPPPSLTKYSPLSSLFYPLIIYQLSLICTLTIISFNPSPIPMYFSPWGMVFRGIGIMAGIG